MTRPIPTFHQNLSERRRRDIDRIDDMTAKDTTVSGRHLITGVGETTFDIAFPVTFSRRPLFTFGWELDEAHSPVAGSFPGGDACIVSWTTVGKVQDATDGYFTAATIAARTRIGSGQSIWLHWSFRAPGMRNPVQTHELLEDDL